MSPLERTLLDASVQELERREPELRELAKAIAGEAVLERLGVEGYASVKRHAAAWILEHAGEEGGAAAPARDSELVARMLVCALAREVQTTHEWRRCVENPEVAHSAYELARLTAESSSSCRRWAVELRVLREAAVAAAGAHPALSERELLHLHGLLSDDFNVVLLLYLGRAALHGSFGDAFD